MKHGSRIEKTGNADQRGASASRPNAKRSGKRMGGVGAHPAKMGNRGNNSARRNTGSVVASLVPGAKAADAQEVVLTVRLTEKQAAVFKDMADSVGATPEEMVVACACADVAASGGDGPEDWAFTAFSAVRDFVRQKKTPAYSAGGIAVCRHYTQEDNG